MQLMITLSAKKTIQPLILITIGFAFLSVAGHAFQYFLGSQIMRCAQAVRRVLAVLQSGLTLEKTDLG